MNYHKSKEVFSEIRNPARITPELYNQFKNLNNLINKKLRDLSRVVQREYSKPSDIFHLNLKIDIEKSVREV